jgi:hypothetical protein
MLIWSWLWNKLLIAKTEEDDLKKLTEQPDEEGVSPEEALKSFQEKCEICFKKKQKEWKSFKRWFFYPVTAAFIIN